MPLNRSERDLVRSVAGDAPPALRYLAKRMKMSNRHERVLGATPERVVALAHRLEELRSGGTSLAKRR